MQVREVGELRGTGTGGRPGGTYPTTRSSTSRHPVRSRR
jgi:hypothetical protein